MNDLGYGWNASTAPGNSELIAGIVFLATLIRSTFGFGEALVAVPLLALIIPVEEAVPLATLLSVTVATIVMIQDWRSIHFEAARKLVVATLLGIPLGLLLLISLPENGIKAALGTIMIAFSSFCLCRPQLKEWTDDRWAGGFGFLAGILGGAYGMNGPPLVIYGALRRWSPQVFRATLQGYFLPASLLGLGGYLIAGLWTAQVSLDFACSLPGAIVAIFCGRWINHRLRAEHFRRYVYIGLLLLGIVLLVQCTRDSRCVPVQARKTAFFGDSFLSARKSGRLVHDTFSDLKFP